MERERERLEELQTENCNLEQMLESCPLKEEAELITKLHRNKELLENQRKLFDDLEFQQLEVNIIDFEKYFVCLFVDLEFNVRPIAKVIWIQDPRLKSHLTDWRSLQ